MKKLSVIFFITFSIFVSLNSYAQKINPGDGIRISFLDIKDITTGDYYIQPNGLINLPLIGIIDTKNKDFEEIRAEIISRYSSLYKKLEENNTSAFYERKLIAADFFWDTSFLVMFLGLSLKHV